MWTMKDVIADFMRVRAHLVAQAEFFENGPGQSPALPIETVREWIAEYDSLIAEYYSV